MDSQKQTGLRGISVGQTAIATVGKEGKGLSYRGYDIFDLAEHANFEEVAYLLIYGNLPDKSQLGNYTEKLQRLRAIPRPLIEVIERIPKQAHPMDMMRTACSMLGTLEPEQDFKDQYTVSDRLLAIFPSMLGYWYQYVSTGKRIDTKTDEPTIAGHLIHLITGDSSNDLHRRAMDVSLILYAEHELNASTFDARVCAATLSDFYSAVTAGIGTLRGPLHGGANEVAMELIQQFGSPEEAQHSIREMLDRKVKIMGFGHAVYSTSDPRNIIIKAWANKLADQCHDTTLFPVSEAIENLMWTEKRLFPQSRFLQRSRLSLYGNSNLPFYTSVHLFEDLADGRLTLLSNVAIIG